MLQEVAAVSLLVGAMIPAACAQNQRLRPDGPGVKSHSETARTGEDQASAAIRRKLVSIIIPSIEFRSTTVEDAIEFLRQEGRRLDPDPDPQSRGLNIILRLPPAAQTASDARQSVPASQAGSAVLPANLLFDPPVPSTRPRITLAMNRLPLLEALRYVAIQAGLKVRVDPYAVSLVPLTENTDALVTAVFRVSPNFIDNRSNGSGPSALDQAATSAH